MPLEPSVVRHCDRCGTRRVFLKEHPSAGGVLRGALLFVVLPGAVYGGCAEASATGDAGGVAVLAFLFPLGYFVWLAVCALAERNSAPVCSVCATNVNEVAPLDITTHRSSPARAP